MHRYKHKLPILFRLEIIGILIIIFFQACGKKKPILPSLPAQLELIIETGHRDSIICIAFHPDNQTLFSASADGEIHWWDLETQQDLFVFKMPANAKGGITNLTMANEGRYLVAGTHDGQIMWWDLSKKNSSPQKIWQAHSKAISSLLIGMNSLRIVSGSIQGEIKLWRLDEKAELLATFVGHKSKTTKLQISRDLKKLGSMAEDSTVRVWEIDKSTEYRKWYLPETTKLAWFNENISLMYSYEPQKGILNEWDVKNWKKNTSRKITEQLSCCGDDWIVENGKLATIKPYTLEFNEFANINITSNIKSVIHQINGNYLAAITTSNTLWVQDYTKQQNTLSFGRNIITPSDINIAPDESFLFLTIHSDSKQQLLAYNLNNITEVFSKETKLLPTQHIQFPSTQTLLLADPINDQLLECDFKLQVKRTYPYLQPFAALPDASSWFAMDRNHCPSQINTQNSNSVQRLSNTPIVTNLMAYYSQDNNLICVDTASYTRIDIKENKTYKKDTAFFNFPHLFHVLYDETPVLFEVKNGVIGFRNILTGQIHKITDISFGVITAIDISPDGKLVMVGDQNGHANLYDLKSKRLIKTLIHTGKVNSVRFAANGKWGASIDASGQIFLWASEPGRELLRATLWINSHTSSPSLLLRTDKGHLDGNWELVSRNLKIIVGNKKLKFDEGLKTLKTSHLFQTVMFPYLD